MKKFFGMLFLTMLLSSFYVNACFTSWLAAYMIKQEYEEDTESNYDRPYYEGYCCGVKKCCPKENKQQEPDKHLKNNELASKK